MRSSRHTVRLVCAILVSGLVASTAVGSVKKQIAQLPPEYQQWLEEVDLLILEKEKKEFLALEKDYQRDAFIERFWDSRDPYVETERNELRDAWEARLEFVREEFTSLYEDRSRIFLLNGEPTFQESLNLCPMLMHPVELWYYETTGRATSSVADVYLIFYPPFGMGNLELWRPNQGFAGLFAEPVEILVGRCPKEYGGITSRTFSVRDISLECAVWIVTRECDRSERGRWVAGALRKLSIDERLGGFDQLVSQLERKTAPRDAEWLDSFAAYSTDLPEDAETFSADVEFEYRGRRGSRTVVESTVTVPVVEVEQLDLDGRLSYNFQLTGEVLREEELFESFRYRFDVPVDLLSGDIIPMTFQRLLRPGAFTIVMKIEDLNSGKLFRKVLHLSVPETDLLARSGEPADPETARLEAEAEAALRDTDRTLRLIAPEGERLIGPVRFDTAVTGPDLAKVSFFLDGESMLIKKRPPFSIELDLGRVPRPHTLRAVGYDDDDIVVVSDEIQLNVGKHHFGVKLVEPQRNRNYSGRITARAEIEIPESKALDRLELYVGETLIATLYQPPYSQPIELPRDGELTYVRAVAWLEDGNTTEDMVFINAPDLLEEVDVQFVQLYTSVLDSAGRPIQGLGKADFRVQEDGVPQEIVRFEVVEEMPIHAGILFDTSASMVDRIEQARDAALKFFRQIIRPRDRASFITFNQRPTLAAQFTDDVDALARELAGLKAEGGTALYDSIVFSLYYFTGIRGQRALLILSDGQDQSSRYTFDEALEYAQTVGVKIYTIGLDLPKSDTKARGELGKLADETGGRSFFVSEVGELDAIYSAIEEELRSQYLLAYQSTNTSGGGDFRTVEVAIPGRDAEARTLRGYFP
jgi:Ca-activated chloride channel family protein